MFHKIVIKRLSCILSLALCISLSGVQAFAEADTRTEDTLSEPMRMQALAVMPTDSGEEQELLYEQIPVTQFRVSELSPQVNTELDYTDWWYSEWEDCRYVFLPATADRSRLTITYEADAPLYLNGEQVVSGQSTGLLSEEDTFSVRVGETDCGTLKIMQSNLGCIYLNTSHGGLDFLDTHGSDTETGTVLMLNAQGGTEYAGALEKLTRHGNSSWDYSKKKPYNFKLPEKANLYGMGKAKKWTLLSNYLDHSMLRNKMTLEMSRAGGMEYVMDSVFVDLYADGSYRGTYQLIERVQIQKNRVNIVDLEEETEKLNAQALDTYPHSVKGADSPGVYMENSYKYYEIPNNPKDITGGYLVEFQQWNRYGYKEPCGFVTSRGQAVTLKSPEYASEEQVLYIRTFMQELEDAIYSPTGYNEKGKHYSDYIDVDSLIAAYLVQEISMNIDGTNTSFFFWKDSDLKGDGRLHCGPAWDFDLAYNNFGTHVRNSDGDIGYSYKYDNLYTAYFPINGYDSDLTDNEGSGRPTSGISWVGTLLKKGDITKRTAEIFFERFVPYLDALTDTEQEGGALLMQMAQDMLPSANMNNMRWHTYGGSKYTVFGSSSGKDFMESVDIPRSYLQKRSAWLKDLWRPLLEADILRGDVNDDGVFSLADAVMLQRWLLKTDTLTSPEAGDLNGDGIIDIFDLVVMKRELLNP